jgi:hypothetical protein
MAAPRPSSPRPRLLPAALDLDAHLAAHPPGFAPFHRECLIELLHRVHSLPVTNRKLAARVVAMDGYVPLKAARLQAVERNYSAYLKYAQATKLLECDNWYLPGDKCRGYRFCAPFRTPPAGSAEQADRVLEITDPRLLQKLERQRHQPLPLRKAKRVDQTPAPAPRLSARRPASPLAKDPRRVYPHLLQWLDPASSPLRIRADEALAFIADYRARRLRAAALTVNCPNRNARAKRPAGRSRVTDEGKSPQQQYLQQFTAIDKLRNRDFHCLVDRMGRLHHVLTNLSKQLRKFVYLDGDQGHLVSLDLANSQPFLLNILIQKSFYNAPMKPGRCSGRRSLTLQGDGWRQVEELTRHDPLFYLSITGILQRSDVQGNNEFPADVVLFREWTGSGTFYERMQAAFEQELPPEHRGKVDAKRDMLHVLYSRNRTQSRRKAVFARLFPTVAAILEAYKYTSHKLLPCLMQSLEAHLTLTVIGGRLQQYWPNSPCLTVHDSVIVSSALADRVEAVMRRELTKWVGVAPTFRRTLWGAAPVAE